MTEGGPPRQKPRLSVHLPPGWEIDAAGESRLSGHGSRPLSRPAEAEQCFLSHSPTLRPWIADRRLRISAAVAVLRGGALEPDPHHLLGKAQAKADAYSQRVLHACSAE